MGAIRKAAAGFLVILATAASGQDCVSAVRLLSTRTSVPNLVAGPFSWSGSTLAVAKTQEGAPGAVWFGAYDETLQTIIDDRLVATDARRIVALLWNGSEHALFYTTVNDALFLQRLTLSGDPIGDRIAITSDRTVYSGDDIDAVWSPALNAYVVGRVISQGQFRGLWLTLLETNGTERWDLPAFVPGSVRPSLELAVTESGIIGAFFNNAAGSLVFARADGDGNITVRTMSPGSEFIAATAHNGRFVVARQSSLTPEPKSEIRWFIVDTNQQVVKADATLVEPIGDDAWPLSLISNGEELALAYIDAPRRAQPVERTYRLLRFTIDGTVINNTGFASEAALGRAQSPYPIVWSGTSYLAAAVHSAPDRLNTYLLRHCPLRARIVSPVRNVRVGQTVTFSAVAGGGVPEYQYSWTFPFEIGPKRGQTLDRVFDRTGTYVVTLEVTDFSGAKTQQTITVEVIRPKTRAVRH
ncbi:MAG TPA: PKD domain-containing protein [Thermoanaerobaculia bacterium]|nr:PKD domain-containing protein [Thermoanaerobaculia bacterium]